MSEFGFHLGVYALGLSWSLLGRQTMGTWLCCAQAYPAGLVFIVMISLGLLVSPLPLGGMSIGLSSLGWMALAAGIGMRSVLRASNPPNQNEPSEALAGLVRSSIDSLRGALFPSALFAAVIGLATRANLSTWVGSST